VVAVMTLLFLAPFAGKAIHIDDPMYLWAARQIHNEPFNFYGFDVNWYGYETPMVEANKNPPLVSFYLAFSAALLGWSEWALHLAMLLPAMSIIVAVAFLARFLGASPIGASLTALVMPAVFVSSTTLMSDVLMLALWCGSLTLWIWGLRRQRDLALVVGAILAGLCPLAKYFGLSLLPLLVAFSLISERRIGRWALYLIIPIGFIVGYEILMTNLYDHHPFLDAADYSIELNRDMELGVGLIFFGGCLLPALLFSPFLWTRNQLFIWVAVAAFGGVVLFDSELFGAVTLETGDGLRWGLLVQATVFFVAGLQVLSLAASDLMRDRSANAWLLAFWVGGVVVFAAFANWTINARAILPAAPAVAILIWRRVAVRQGNETRTFWTRCAIVPLVSSLAIAAAVAWGDWRLADNARVAASTLTAKYGSGSGTLWFQGAWGFQHYMEEHGGLRTSTGKTVLEPNDILITPNNNTNVHNLPDNRGLFTTIEMFSLPVSSWVSTMSTETGAGFYTSLVGPLPYVFGVTPPELYVVQKMEKSVRLNRPTSSKR
jgi:4-amino-4-deoxy-L-arabinose transferase-like glycosyltransferase